MVVKRIHERYELEKLTDEHSLVMSPAACFSRRRQASWSSFSLRSTGPGSESLSWGSNFSSLSRAAVIFWTEGAPATTSYNYECQ